MSYSPCEFRWHAMIAASVPIRRGIACPPTSSPSRMRAIPKDSSCSRQRPIISRYCGSNTCNGKVVSGNRTVWRGKSGRRTGCGHPAGGHKAAYFGRMSSPTTHAVRHPGQLTSRRIASPSSAILNVKKSGLLHRGQLKFKPPTVMRLLEGPSGLKVALASRQVYESLVLPRSFMRVEKVVSPPLDNNAYFLFDEASRQAAVVDPALAGKELLAMSEKFGAKIVYILTTHGHPDSTADDASIRTATGAKIAIFEVEAPRLEKNARGSRWFLPAPPAPVKADVLLKEGSELKLGNVVITTLHTPGHTEGSASCYVESKGALYTGDTLYAGSCGRTDVQGGSPAKMVFTLRRLKELPAETRVYPSHGPETTIGDETWISDLTYPVV